MTVQDLMDILQEKIRIGEINPMDDVFIQGEEESSARAIDVVKIYSCYAAITMDGVIREFLEDDFDDED